MAKNNKAVVKLGLTDAKSKKAAKKALVHLQEVKSFTLDLEKSTLVVMGEMDPAVLVLILRKFVSADLITFGPEKNDDGGRNVDQKPPQQQQYQHQHLHGPFYYGIGTSGYDYCYHYN